MARFSMCVVLAFACLAVAVIAGQQSHLAPSAPHTEGRAFLQRAYDEGNLETSHYLPQRLKVHCFYMTLLICFFCLCGGGMKYLLGDSCSQIVIMSTLVGIWWYLMYTGIFSEWLHFGGNGVGPWCQILCIWAIIMTPCIICWSCVLCCMPGALLVRNAVIAEMKRKYEEKLKTLSKPRQDYYTSEAFQRKCDRKFEEADKDQSGELDMEELKEIINTVMESQFEDLLRQAEDQEARDQIQLQSNMMAGMLQQAFQARSTCNKDEFTEMMKFVSVMALQPGKCTTEQAFESLQLDETATAQDFSKAVRNLSRRFHPDKRLDCDPEQAHNDMQDINVAKCHLETHFRNIEKFGEAYRVGDKVQAHSLQNAPALNGMLGTIKEFEDERIFVDFGMAAGIKKLASKNVRYPSPVRGITSNSSDAPN